MRRLAPFLLCLLAPAGAWSGGTDIVITDAWIREMPPGVSPMAAYMQLANNGNETVVLTGVSSSYFKRIELHRSRIEGEVARMERRETLTLSPGQRMKLQPGDYHLMLFEPVQSLKAGDRIPLTFSFKDRPPQTVETEIRPYNGNPDGHHHYH